MNRRRQTNTLGSTDIRRLEAAKYNAEKLGRPLNCFATFNPVRGGGTFTKDPADLFGDVRNWIKMRLRRYGIEPTAIWTIENSPAGGCVVTRGLGSKLGRNRPWNEGFETSTRAGGI